MRKFQAAVVSIALTGCFAAGCGGKPTKDECDLFADKFVTLMLAGEGAGGADETAKTLGAEVKAGLVDDCVKEGTKKEIDCVLAASTIEEVEANCK
jgi:hypothetical protein